MSRYIVSLLNNESVKQNYIYRVIKENGKDMAIIDDNGEEYWISKEDEGFSDFKILY